MALISLFEIKERVRFFFWKRGEKKRTEAAERMARRKAAEGLRLVECYSCHCMVHVKDAERRTYPYSIPEVRYYCQQCNIEDTWKVDAMTLNAEVNVAQRRKEKERCKWP
jgi:hypothetical protein